ncbi:hypothetical protein GCM10023193_05100 [Planotetraspora kaengkrachanensis]|uniref:Uncharacterized protein n=1 Tax=Planotetraspora kaengkrachanensis TaxID=575193 RepID=A0A8J3PQ15_9ACTN|nr:hypothetical protein Pka01_00510 [Planotetraspora kaengkrachanensis]
MRQLRDPRTNPPWHDLSTLAGYPAGVVSVSSSIIFNGAFPFMRVMAETSTGQIAQTVCAIGIPIPILGGFFAPGVPGGPPPYPANCTAWVDHTPPNRVRGSTEFAKDDECRAGRQPKQRVSPRRASRRRNVRANRSRLEGARAPSGRSGPARA